MRKRDVQVDVSDHAILRFLEREHDIDVEAIRKHISGLAQNGAQLSAVSVSIGRGKLVLKDFINRDRKQANKVVVVTALKRGDALGKNLR